MGLGIAVSRTLRAEIRRRLRQQPEVIDLPPRLSPPPGESPPGDAALSASLLREFNVLKKQWGNDAKGMRLSFGDMGPGRLGGFAPGSGSLRLNLDVIRNQVESLSPFERSITRNVEGHSVESLAHAVLRHEFGHGVTSARESRLGTPDVPMTQYGGRAYIPAPDDAAHGKMWNRLNVSLQGAGSDLPLEHIGFPPGMARGDTPARG